MEGIDIYRSARLYSEQYGSDAATYAVMRVDALAEVGDIQGAAAWKRIIRAISEIMAKEGETAH